MMSQFLFLGGVGFQELILILFVVLVPIALCVTAAVSIGNSKHDSTTKVLWFLVILFFPFLGPLIYFSLGRGMSREA
jgi:hypothetical protein